MNAHKEDVALLTIRARRDPAYPREVFIRVRTYRIPGDPEPVMSTETVSVDDVLTVVKNWLRNPDDPSAVTLQ